MRHCTPRPMAWLRQWPWPLVVVGCVAAAYVAWQHSGSSISKPSQTQRVQSAQAAPVHVAVVETNELPVVLNGLGTVQATNTVTVRSRVDGQIEKVGFEEGQMVHEGDLLVQIDPAPFKAALGQAVAKLAQDQASLTNAKQDLQRTSVLAKQGNATQQLLDQRTANVASLAAQVQADQAAIDSAEVQLAYTTIKSPLTGRAGFRLVDPGNIVHANDQTGILTITQLQPISVVFTAPEQQLPAINDALESGPLKVTAYSSDGKKQLAEGTLKLLDNQVDPASGTIRLKASFNNSDTALWPGLSVTTRLLVRTLKNVVVVPDAAVQRGPNGLYAYVVTPASKAELRSIKVGQIEGGLALIEQGLSPGERIVTSGHYRVQPGGPVHIVADREPRTAVTPTVRGVD
jgi:membrane fusion protein, multidrug efflux system